MEHGDRELVDLMLQGVRAEIKAKDEIIMLKLNQIINQTTKMSSRVTKIEEQTAIGRWFERSPARFAVVGIILFFLASIGGTELIMKIIKLL